jgi:hypothetical protein
VVTGDWMAIVRLRSLIVLSAVAALAAGCSDDDEPVAVGPPEVVATTPTYDAGLEPSAAVLAVVPSEATVLEVTDFDQARFSLGYGDLSSETDPSVLRKFARQADRESALLSPGILRDSGSGRRYGFGQDDVEWEAHFDGPSGEGYVVKFHDDLDMAGVQRAAEDPDSPLSGATVVPTVHLAALGATRDPARSWAAEPDLVALVGQTSVSTYVARDCLTVDEAFGDGVADELAPTPAADVASLAPLGPFSVAFGGELVTARLGAPRVDVFTRARLADTLPDTDPEFGLGYVDAVADPQGGRIGYNLGDGPVAARLAVERQLPFAVCGG